MPLKISTCPFAKNFRRKYLPIKQVSQYGRQRSHYQIDFFQPYLYQANIQDLVHCSFLLRIAFLQGLRSNYGGNHEKSCQFCFLLQPLPRRQAGALQIAGLRAGCVQLEGFLIRSYDKLSIGLTLVSPSVIKLHR